MVFSAPIRARGKTMPGRPPKPTAVLEMTGAARKNPKRMRERAGEPQSPGGLGDPPERYLLEMPSAREKLAIWQECQAMWPWIGYSDRMTVEDICELTYKLRHNTIAVGERAQLKGLRNDMGGSPSGRGRLGSSPAPAVAPTSAADPRDAYLTRAQGG